MVLSPRRGSAVKARRERFIFISTRLHAPFRKIMKYTRPGVLFLPFSPSLSRPRKIRDRAENSSARFEFREIKIRERIVFPREIVVTAGSLRFSA